MGHAVDIGPHHGVIVPGTISDVLEALKQHDASGSGGGGIILAVHIVCQHGGHIGLAGDGNRHIRQVVYAKVVYKQQIQSKGEYLIICDGSTIGPGQLYDGVCLIADEGNADATDLREGHVLLRVLGKGVGQHLFQLCAGGGNHIDISTGAEHAQVVVQGQLALCQGGANQSGGIEGNVSTGIIPDGIGQRIAQVRFRNTDNGTLTDQSDLGIADYGGGLLLHECGIVCNQFGHLSVSGVLSGVLLRGDQLCFCTDDLAVLQIELGHTDILAILTGLHNKTACSTDIAVGQLGMAVPVNHKGDLLVGIGNGHAGKTVVLAIAQVGQSDDHITARLFQLLNAGLCSFLRVKHGGGTLAVGFDLFRGKTEDADLYTIAVNDDGAVQQILAGFSIDPAGTQGGKVIHGGDLQGLGCATTNIVIAQDHHVIADSVHNRGDIFAIGQAGNGSAAPGITCIGDDDIALAIRLPHGSRNRCHIGLHIHRAVDVIRVDKDQHLVVILFRRGCSGSRQGKRRNGHHAQHGNQKRSELPHCSCSFLRWVL